MNFRLNLSKIVSLCPRPNKTETKNWTVWEGNDWCSGYRVESLCRLWDVSIGVRSRQWFSRNFSFYLLPYQRVHLPHDQLGSVAQTFRKCQNFKNPYKDCPTSTMKVTIFMGETLIILRCESPWWKLSLNILIIPTRLLIPLGFCWLSFEIWRLLFEHQN